MGVWFLLDVPQVAGMMEFSAVIIRRVLGSGWSVAVDLQSDPILLVSAMFEGRVAAQVQADPLLFTRGLPLYLALVLALPGSRFEGGQRLLTCLWIALASLMGFSFLMLLRMDLALQASGLEHSILWKGLESLEPQVGAIEVGVKLTVTRLLPLGLWFWVARDFMALFLTPGTDQS